MAKRIEDGVFLVGGGGLTAPGDCLCYAIDLGDLVLVDCGVGPGWGRLRDQIVEAGYDPLGLHTLLLTHAHIDHAGAAAGIAGDTGCRVVAHALDAPVIETGDPVRSAADWYGTNLPPTPVHLKIEGSEARLAFSAGELRLVHTPGHTPGSLVAVLERGGQRILFGQDIHGPFDAAFGSDVAAWRRSIQTLLALEADVLCEGHYGVFRGRKAVREFVEGQLAAHAGARGGR